MSLHWPCERKLLQIEWLTMPADHPHNPTNKNKTKKKAYGRTNGGRNTNFTARPNGAKVMNLISNDASMKDYVNNDACQLQNGGTNATLEIESIKKQIQQMNHMMMMMMYKGKGPTASDEHIAGTVQSAVALNIYTVNDWIVDTGATDHICSSLNLMHFVHKL